MRVLEFRNIQRKEALLYYRREFKAEAVIEYINRSTTKQVEFVLENKPLGGYDVHVQILEDIEYPLVPFVQTLKSFIIDLETRGSLP